MAIVINGNGIDMGNSPISNVDVGVFDNNAATVDYVKNNGDVNAVTSFSQISGTNEITGLSLTNNIHDIFNDGSNIATYTLDGNANDLSGTYNGNATNVTYGDGKFGQAGLFSDASNSAITTTLKPTQSFGLSFWVNIADVSKNLNGGVAFSTSLFGNSSQTMFAVQFSSFRIHCYTSNGATHSHIEFNSNGMSGEWIHCVAIGNTTSFSFYVNGVHIGTNNFTYRDITGQTLRIGTDTNGYGLNGYIDQVRVFNRPLTESEVNTLYTETRVSVDAQLNIQQGTFIYPKGLGARGYMKSSDTFTGIVDVSTQTDGWKYVAKDESNNFSFYTDKPTIGKKSSTLYLENGKLYKAIDDTPIDPISFLSNKVRIASGVAVELAPSDISKTVSESLEAGSYFGKNAIIAYASIDMTTTPPTILDSYNIASVIRSSNGVGKVTLINPTDEDVVTAICGSNSVAGTITSTTKSEISFATGATNYAKTSVIVIGGKF